MPRSAGTAYVDIEPRVGQQFGNSIGNSVDGAFKRAFGRVGTIAKTAVKGAGIAAAAGVIGGAFAVIKTGVGEVKDADAGLHALGSVIESTGNKAGVSVKGLEALASSIQGYSGQTDDSIVKSEELLLTFTNIQNRVGKGNDIFNQATKLTADLAARLGGDASGAAIQLGKALNDPVKGITALTRVGVSFTQKQKDQVKAMVASGHLLDAQKLIVGELTTEFGGAAKAAGDSIPGGLEKAKRSFEDFSQSIVTTLIPVIAPVFAAIAQGARNLAPLIQAGIARLVTLLSKVDFAAGFRTFKRAVLDTAAVVIPFVQDRLIPLLVRVAQAVIPPLTRAASDLAKIFREVVVPILAQAADFVEQHLAPVLGFLTEKFAGFVSFLAQHTGAVKYFAVVVLGLLAARLVAIKVNQAVTGIRTLATVVANAHKPFVELAQNAGKLFSALKSGVTTVASFAKSVVIGTARVVAQTVAFVAQRTAQVAGAAATKAMAVAQWLLNAAMDANPVILIVAGIAALVAGVILAYQKFGPFRDIVDATGRALAAAAGWIKDAIVGVFNWVKDHWPLILGILTGPIGLAVLFIISNWQRLKAITAAVFGAIAFVIGATLGAARAIVERVIGGIRDYISFNLAVVKGVWDRFWGGLHVAVDTAGRIIKGGVNGILGTLEAIYGAFRRIWNAIEIDLPKVHIPGTDTDIGGGTLGLPDLPDVTLPRLAKGTVARSPMLAVIGETAASRPEIVTPDSLLRKIVREESGGKGKFADTVNLYGVKDTDDAVRKLTWAARTRGR